MALNDRVLGVFALALAAFLTAFGYGLEAPFAYEPVGPRAFPLLLAFIIAVCGVRLLFKGGNPVEPNPPGANARILMMVGFLAAYALMFQWLGFVVATAAMTIFVGRLFGGAWLRCVIGGVVMALFFFLLFDKALDVVLPTGILGDLL
ncbi:tripartite tricarboxylate transporter TctB family protein [Achromobacter sp. GG226]|uniref:tripartite tricarboxylate transporter TctB family protein n=1 Tax=Verticiella alkaliphila TaxID=2779529 RepID=UPI001C0D20D2|nr:tripartite tricarboxylate transporter TctB family protein [Verticiella sp. GG226]MBU4611049.1 tripartite tricarboxylate transporter TctB family protein [Verticiella sp. GG226]